MTTVAVATLGCKVNQFESEALMEALERRGYVLVPLERGAEIAIINTCTVTHRADFQSRQTVRKALRFNPNALIIVTGCYPQVEPDAFLKIQARLHVLGNKEKNEIPDLLPRMQESGFPNVQVGDIQKEAQFSETPVRSFHRHTRAFLKIQDGCNGRCAYCIVPRARGPSRSLLPEKIVEHAQLLKQSGVKEVILTGIHLGAYGLDLASPFPLQKLLRVLEKEQTPDRIRLSSTEPRDFSPQLISTLSQSQKICPHLHIPIQSGDDEILKRMNRDYDRSFLSDLIRELTLRIPNLSIGADVIVGFPGETEEKFNQSYNLVESLPFSYLHVFPFSRRKGTPACEFPQRVEERDIKKRAERMRSLGSEKRRAFYRQFLHRDLSVLIEGHQAKNAGGWRGLSRNYIPVLLADEEGGKDYSDQVNEECTVRMTGLAERGMVGELLER